jgi:hypothetical protein
VAQMNTQIKALKYKRADACPECGEPKSRYADTCRECYQKSGGLGPKVHDAIFGDDGTLDRALQSRGRRARMNSIRGGGTQSSHDGRASKTRLTPWPFRCDPAKPIREDTHRSH